MLPPTFFALLNSGLNEVLQVDPQAQLRLRAMGEQTVRMELEPFPAFGLYIRKGELNFGIEPNDYDLAITGHVAAFVRYAMAEQREDIQFQGEVDIAQDLSNFFSKLDLDLEERLSHVLGDTSARVIGRTLEDVILAAQTFGDAVADNVRDYLREESDVTPHQEEVDAFMHEVDNLRDDLERLEVGLDRVLGPPH